MSVWKSCGKTFDTNFFGAIAVTKAFLPLLKKSSGGRIVNVSSGLGSLALHSAPDSYYYDIKPLAYNTSKTALNRQRGQNDVKGILCISAVRAGRRAAARPSETRTPTPENRASTPAVPRRVRASADAESECRVHRCASLTAQARSVALRRRASRVRVRRPPSRFGGAGKMPALRRTIFLKCQQNIEGSLRFDRDGNRFFDCPTNKLVGGRNGDA